MMLFGSKFFTIIGVFLGLTFSASSASACGGIQCLTPASLNANEAATCREGIEREIENIQGALQDLKSDDAGDYLIRGILLRNLAECRDLLSLFY